MAVADVIYADHPFVDYIVSIMRLLTYAFRGGSFVGSEVGHDLLHRIGREPVTRRHRQAMKARAHMAEIISSDHSRVISQAYIFHHIPKLDM